MKKRKDKAFKRHAKLHLFPVSIGSQPAASHPPNFRGVSAALIAAAAAINVAEFENVAGTASR